MQNGEKLIAIESIISQFAQNQFAANNVSALEARLIMEAVTGRFQQAGLESVIMGMVSVDQEPKMPAEERTGTVEDLKRAFAGKSEAVDCVEKDKAVFDMLKAAAGPLSREQEPENIGSK